MTPKGYTTIGGLTLALWLASLALPAFEHGSAAGDDQRYLLAGAEYLLWGWYDVLARTGIAWLAHPVLCFNIGCLLSGRVPLNWVALPGVLIAATALIPFYGGQYDDSLQGPLVARSGTYLWLTAAGVPALTALVARRSRTFD